MDRGAFGIDFRKIVAALSNFEIHQIKCEDIADPNYGAVSKNLRNGALTSCTLNIDTMTMTPLEFAVYKEEWKIILVLMLGGADPKDIIFDVIIHTMASYYGEDEPEMYDDFKDLVSGEYEPIPGFDGLACILEDVISEVDQEYVENRAKMVATLWLTKYLYEKFPVTEETMETARNHVHTLQPDCDWSSAFVDKRVALEVNSVVLKDAAKKVEDLALPDFLADAIRGCLESIVAEAVDSDNGTY